MSKSCLVFAWGNPSRGDDALGPLFIERLEAQADGHPEWGSFDCLSDFQLQIEHALDLAGRERVLFVDASLSCAAPFEVLLVTPCRDQSYTSHAMSPGALLQVYRELNGEEPPASQLLAIRGLRFELGEPLSRDAQAHLDAALAWTGAWLSASSSGRRAAAY
ncbi:MAG TPA: hydrogenase maturation protease [Rhodocyclaceae bacterium]|nr:hydrogenase maturation protease [Rhodocyclaceae bacterium]